MKRFLIVGTQRTGSSAVAESLGLHPNVTCGWEWTLQTSRRKKFNAAENALSGDFSWLSRDDQEHMKEVHTQTKTWIGFRWLFSSSAKWILHPRFSPALWIDRLEDFIKWSSRRTDIHIIHIVRRDCLDWLKSVYLSKNLKLYSKNRYPDGIRVKIPIREAIWRLNAKKWVDSRLSVLNQSNPYLLIIYEDFLNNQKKVLTSALAFIECDYALLNLDERILKKQSKKNTSEYIINYTDLSASLSKRDLLFSNLPIAQGSE